MKKKLTIQFERSFKPDEMDGINESISRPLQNDSIFYDGSFLLRLGTETAFSEKYTIHIFLLLIGFSVLFVSQVLYFSMQVVTLSHSF